MGLPSISITFQEARRTAIARGNRGIVAMILEDTTIDKKFEIDSVERIPAELNDFNKHQIELVRKGFSTQARKIIAYVIDPAGELTADYGEAKVSLEASNWDYLVVPEIKEGAVNEISSFVKSLKDDKERNVKAVLPNVAANHEAIINFTTGGIKTQEGEFSAAEYCSRIAGIIAGTPLNSSCTFAPLPEVIDCERKTRDEYDLAVKRGELVLFHDGEKVKIARGVNSLTDLSGGKSESFKKIKVVDAMGIIYKDIKMSIEDGFLGKYSNSYDNKCLLIAAVQAYLENFENEGVLERGYTRVDIDMESQANYLKGLGYKIEEMTEKEIREADTKDKVFLTASIKILDAIEEITLPIAI